MDLLQILALLIVVGIVGLVLAILVALAMGVHALVSRLRGPQAPGHAAPTPPKRKPYHRMSHNERREVRGRRPVDETGEFRHA